MRSAAVVGLTVVGMVGGIAGARLERGVADDGPNEAAVASSSETVVSTYETPSGSARPVGSELIARTRSENGSPVCGLGRAFHEGRRAALLAELGDEVFVIRGLDEPRDYLKFYQDKNFWYLTGIDSPGAALVLDGRTDEEFLFLPRHDPFKEQWDGEIWDVDDAWVGELTGFEDRRPREELESFLAERLAERPPVRIVRTPWVALAGGTDMASPHERRQAADPFDGRPSREKRLEEELESRYGVECADASRLLAKLRIVKEPEEIEAMRRAARVGSAAIAEAIRCTAPERGEWELEALMSFMHERYGAAGPAYSAICASGPNNNVLHYFHSSRRMHAGELLLVDYGPDVDHYTTDITRTWPVSGKFDERQRKLYDIVLEAQQAGIAAAKPGNGMGDVGAAIQAVFERHGVQGMVRHAPTHYIGLEVHDVGVRGPFRPGMTLAIEPGLYDDENGFGIRIEDVVLITDDGCEILTREGLPVDAEGIEALAAEAGLLDR